MFQIIRTMKKYLGLFAAAVTLVACTEETRFNTPAFEGQRDGSFWRAGGMSAQITEAGGLKIEGRLQNETVLLELPTMNVATYPLGNSLSRRAIFTRTENGNEEMFRTGSSFGNGQIRLTEVDIANGTISGTFRFNAIRTTSTNPQEPDNNDILNFTNGVFYKVPVTGFVSPNPMPEPTPGDN